jgi:uncharacterized membrane protein
VEMREVVPPRERPAEDPASNAPVDADAQPALPVLPPDSARSDGNSILPTADEPEVSIDEQLTLLDSRHSRVASPNGHPAHARGVPLWAAAQPDGPAGSGNPDATTFQDGPSPPLPAWQTPADAPYAHPASPAITPRGQHAHVPWQVARTWGPTTLTIGSNAAAGMSYLLGWISGVLVYFNERDNRFVRFHALQSILLSSALTVLGVAASILHALFHDLTSATHWTVFGALGSGIALLSATGIVLIWLASMIAAWTGHRWRLPIVGAYAERYAAPPLPTPGSYV